MNKLCVFCGSSGGFDEVYRRMAENLGLLLARRGIHLVYGGASVGLMGLLADSVLAHGGEVTGVIPSFFSRREIAHQGLTRLILVDTMHERKKVMADLSDGFLALPGGYGTLDEFFEIVTWAQLGLHNKPAGILNINGYFNLLLAFLDRMESDGFLRPIHHSMILYHDKEELLLEKMENYVAPEQEKWLNRIREGTDLA